MRILATLAISCMFATGAAAQTAAEKAVKASIESLRQALIKRDRATLDKLTTPDLLYSHSNSRLENKAQFLDANSKPDEGYDVLDFGPTTFFTYGDTVVARGDWMVKTRAAGGQVSELKLNVLQVWVKTKAGWKLAARQSTRYL
jgi:ketosteroid isomerase-like protein